MSVNIRVAAMKEIITLSIEDPYVRKTLKEHKRVHLVRDMTDINATAPKAEKPLGEWASRAWSAVDSDDVHVLWSNMFTGLVTEQEVQYFLDGGIISDKCKLAPFVESLKYVIRNE